MALGQIKYRLQDKVALIEAHFNAGTQEIARERIKRLLQEVRELVDSLPTPPGEEVEEGHF